jgi:hypothetical protein
MPRLIDDIRSTGKLYKPWFVAPAKEQAWTEHTAKVAKLLQDPDLPVLLIDNVSEYYYNGTDQEQWDLRDHFPNLAPPYPIFWCEHKLARHIHSKECGDKDLTGMFGSHARTGVLVTSLDPAERGSIIATGIPENAKWVLWCELIIDYGFESGFHPQGSHSPMFLCIDAEGAVIDQPWMQSFSGGAYHDVMRSFVIWLHPTLLAVSFLHCKNVTVVENTVDKPLAKRHYERHGEWPVKYKTLVIEPLKQILRHEGRSGEVGVPKAMHICRGHFRDYREGRGLFGKYHQLVWTPMTVRGTRGTKAPAREIEVRV